MDGALTTTLRGLSSTSAVLRHVVLLAFLIVCSSQVHGGVHEFSGAKPHAHHHHHHHHHGESQEAEAGKGHHHRHHHAGDLPHQEPGVAEAEHCHVVLATICGFRFISQDCGATLDLEHLAPKVCKKSYLLEEPPASIIDVSQE